jgi:rhamnogalacturonyl hydrolase YesR
VEQVRNQKGIALFAKAYLHLYEYTGEAIYLEEAEKLLQWLLQNPSPGRKNLCWGYSFLWQSVPPFCQDRNEPNIVVTCFAGEAFVKAYEITQKPVYLDALNSLARFITEDLKVLHETDEERAIAYILTEVDSIAVNVQSMSAGLLAKIARLNGNTHLTAIARKQIAFVARAATPEHAWPYALPLPGTRPIHIDYHDNFHTGGLLDNMLDYMEASGDTAFMEVYLKGLTYYESKMFQPDGAPWWTDKRRFPYDIHCCAQGILTFAKAARYRPELRREAEKVAQWTINNMYRPEKHDFIYRISRWYKWDYSLVRWCNGWMTKAFSELLTAKS